MQRRTLKGKAERGGCGEEVCGHTEGLSASMSHWSHLRKMLCSPK